MKKHVWIMNHYAGEMLFSCGGRHYNFAKYLKQVGYIPVVFCANTKHGRAEPYLDLDTLDRWHVRLADEIGVPFVFVKARTYTGNGKQRLLNMVDFFWNLQQAAKQYAKDCGRPDIIYASSVHPLTLVAGIQLAKHFGVECVCEVRDLWPETLVSYGSLKRNSVAGKLLYAGEKWIYKKADRLIFTMEGGYDYIQERNWSKKIPRSKVFYINNGVDLKSFRHNREHFLTEDHDLEDRKSFKVVYTGSIRRINNLGLILDTAKMISDPRIKFLIWGDGDELPALRHRVETEQIKNVLFKGRIGKEYIPSVISQADLNIVHWENAELLRFGVSYNKLFEYLAAARPIFSTIHPGYSIVKKYACGEDAEDCTPQGLADSLQRLAALPQSELAKMGENAQKAAEAYDFPILTKSLIQAIEGGESLWVQPQK